MMRQSCRRICLWSGPRNVSTALMYSFARRSDTRVVDEPLYGYYLRVSGAAHPGAAEVMAAMDCDGGQVVREIILGPCDRPVLFLKNMAHHLPGLDRGFLARMDNVLLTRDPREMPPSLAAVLAEPTLPDTGYDILQELLQESLQQGRGPLVLDSRELLLDPAGVLERLCEKLGLPFEPAMLRWPPGPIPEDGVWAPHWYANVHRSRGFALYRPKREPFPAHLQPLLEQCQPYYEALSAHAIRAASAGSRPSPR